VSWSRIDGDICPNPLAQQISARPNRKVQFITLGFAPLSMKCPGPFFTFMH
jgi:hypothetical protein